MKHEHLFTCRYRLSTGMVVIHAAYNPAQFGTHTRINVAVRQNGKVIFPLGSLYCGIPGHRSIDGKEGKELVGSLVAMKPGDTDSDYFDSYTPEQLEWAKENGEELSCLVESRFA